MTIDKLVIGHNQARSYNLDEVDRLKDEHALLSHLGYAVGKYWVNVDNVMLLYNYDVVRGGCYDNRS